MSSPQIEENIQPNKSISYSEIASTLLKDRFLLTALEFHTELIETGKELRQLKDFFSNPGNFELQIPETSRLCKYQTNCSLEFLVNLILLARCGSQATLDSLDLTRYSEDGAGADEKVAVLEFELRKAKETINALRNNLTLATGSSPNSTRSLSLITLISRIGH